MGKPHAACKLLRRKTQRFLRNKDNGSLAEILNLLDRYSKFHPCALTRLAVFEELLKTGGIGDSYPSPPEQDECEEVKNRKTVRESYESSWNLLLTVISSERTSHSDALMTLMKFIALETTYPLDDLGNSGFNFPEKRLRSVLLALLSSEKDTTYHICRFQEYTVYRDVLYFVWKQLPGIMDKQKDPNKIFIKNALELIDKIPIPKPNDDLDFLCDKQAVPEMILNVDTLRVWLNITWDCVMRWNHPPDGYRQLLVLLLERILVHLEKPLMLTDFLMDSLDVGGVASVLALQAIYELVQKHNLNYPMVYYKLYSMFEPEVFYNKHKARLLYLADLFLSSTRLPEGLVAAFAKRFARLTLLAAPSETVVMLLCICNMLIRHPGLKRMINHPIGGQVNEDPFIMEERNPLRSYALHSSLWEVDSLRNHVWSLVCAAANHIKPDLPKDEWSLSKILEGNLDEAFVESMRTKVRRLTMTFVRPAVSVQQPSTARLHNYWNID